MLLVEGDGRDIFLSRGCDEDEDEDRVAFGSVDVLKFEICIYAMRSQKEDFPEVAIGFGIEH